MNIKPEFLDTQIKCPLSGQMMNTTLLDPELYNLYYNNGYAFLFNHSANEDRKAELEIELEHLNDEINNLK